MRKSKFTETQIVKAVKDHEGGRKVVDICRELEISSNTEGYTQFKLEYGLYERQSCLWQEVQNLQHN